MRLCGFFRAKIGDRKAVDGLEETAAHLFLLGKNYYAIRNYAAAKEYLLRAVGKGSSGAARLLLELGRRFLADENFREAEECFQALADRGSAEGCLYLGKMARNGLGVERDIQMAFDYFTEAYRLGMSAGAFEAGKLMLPEAFAVPRVREIAIEWFKEAAADGITEAYTEIGVLLCDGLPVHHREALEWFLRGVRQGDCDAMIYAADIYLSGIGVEQNVRLALFLLNKASEGGSGKANRILAALYREGRYVEKNPEISRMYERKGKETSEGKKS